MDWGLLLDLAGTFFFAVSGSLLAARHAFDIVGSFLLGALTGLGGGVMRDVVLGVAPVAFAEPVHLLSPVAAAALVFFLMPGVERFPRMLLVFDAGGLALFCTTGTTVALASGMNPISATLLGAMTGIGGGLLRDVVANREPQVFNPRDLYAVPALLGAGLTATLWVTGLLGPISLIVVATFVFAFRVTSLKFRWHVPLASRHAASETQN